ncbi:Inner membrane protein [Caballeronia sordidicola]|uniref:Flagellar brake protein YcgR n=2 Tax=Caballeronia sordidicola TaxID=196367 RepID=A0A242MMM0_CABSO|nr:Inner membrane protein [Caballeronia sordidicola]
MPDLHGLVGRAPALILEAARANEHGKPMNMNESNGSDIADDESDHPDFGRRNPLEIGVSLRNLVNRSDFLTVDHGKGQIVTRLLDVNPAARTFVFDWGAVADENTVVLSAENLMFSASPDGVRVEFATGTPREIVFEGRPAFEADFPPVLFYMQRREYFRVEAPVLDPYICSGILPSGERFRFEVNDLSLGGVALRTMDERVAALEVGVILKDVELHFSNPGKVVLDVQLMSNRQIVNAKGDRRYTLGFKFMSLPGSAENTLQRLITQLEMKRRSLAR